VTGHVDPERERIGQADRGEVAWRAWGPYLADRAWGTVREDYSPDGDAWRYFPYEQSRSRAYRWSEDGLGGLCDARQRLCFAFAFWNGADRELKERAFGLANAEGNHGEDVKEYWWYLDSTPTHSWMQWRYHYPQRPFPYDDLRRENASRGRDQPEYELADTGIFGDGRYFEVSVDYAKAGSEDYCIRLRVTNHGPDPALLHVLPTVWFRNTWAWRLPVQGETPLVRTGPGRLTASHPDLGTVTLFGDGAPEPLACDNETNAELLFGSMGRSRYPKDGIGDHVVRGTASVNPVGVGTKASLWYRLQVPAAGTREIRLRLSKGEVEGLGSDWGETLSARQREADLFFETLLPPQVSRDERLVVRQGLAGLMWSKQFYHWDVEQWLDGDPAGPTPPAQRLSGRDSGWRHFNSEDVLLMPDCWEYPWFAAWDLAFHAAVAAHVDPWLAKQQLLLLGREWYMHPEGQLPAYEWNFSDANPPVHAWAALHVFHLDGSRDYDFLERIFHKLLINFTWWVNRKDVAGADVFQGGFLGLDNIGPFDRSHLPVPGVLEQSDGTAWMARYCLDMLEIALELALHDRTYADIATKFFEHFCYIAAALQDSGLWDEQDGFFYDVLRLPTGAGVPLRVRSMVGLLPLCGVLQLTAEHLRAVPDFVARLEWFTANRPHLCRSVHPAADGEQGYLLSVISTDQLGRVLGRVLDESEFLSEHGLRALSAYHRDHPFSLAVGGITASVDYEPAESRTGLFGGNSNWRGPVWAPLNYLLIQALRRYARYSPGAAQVSVPGGGSGLAAAVAEVSRRLLSLYVSDGTGRRPVHGRTALYWTDPAWRDLLPFHEYFDGDTGAGLGASHQTGWTALLSALILERRPLSGG
jgi:hypothetical protein